MLDGNASSGVRRTTRIELACYTQIARRGSDTAVEMPDDAQTLVVSMHGARLECEHTFKVDDEVDILVYLTGKKARGRVSWTNVDWASGIVRDLRKQLRSSPAPYSAENRNPENPSEFAVELYEPQDLWTFLVESPPQDWQEWINS